MAIRKDEVEQLLKQIESGIPQIAEDRSYWLVRTSGGHYYEEFYTRKYIAIGYNEIELKAIYKDEHVEQNVYNAVSKKFADADRPGLIASQIIRFVKDIKKGDLVIIPSTSSKVISFGVVQDNEASENEIVEDGCPHKKIRRVKWIKTLQRGRLEPQLYKIFFTHQTIANVSDYAEWIDSTTNDFYTKAGKTHVVLHVEKNTGINARLLFSTGSKLLDALDQYDGDAVKDENVEVKLTLHSPGIIEFIAISAVAMAFLGLLVVALTGGETDIALSKNMQVKLKSPGFLKAISNFRGALISDNARKALLEHALKELEVQKPKDLYKLLLDATQKDDETKG